MMDMKGKEHCRERRAFAALARGIAVFALASAAGRGFGEGIAFSSNWTAFFSHHDVEPPDSISALALAGNTLFLAGVLGQSYLGGTDENGSVYACNDPGYSRSDAFAAYLPVSGGVNARPVFSLLESEDNATTRNLFAALSVADGALVCAGAGTDLMGEVAEATVVRYDAGSLDEDWRFSLSFDCLSNSAFYAVSAAPDGSVYAAGSTDCATNGFRPGGLVYKFNSGGGVAWSNLLGGGVSCRVNACAAPGDDALYLAGAGTNGTGATVGFLKRLDRATGTEVYAATCESPITALAVAPDGTLLLGGSSGGALYKFMDSGSGFTRVWTTNLASSASISALAVDASNRVAVAGTASSAWFEATDGTAFSEPRSGFAAILPSDGNALLFAGWIGGDGETTADAVAFSDNVLAVGGSTKATNLASGGFCVTNWNAEARWSDEPYEPCGYVKVWLGETFIPNPPGTLHVFLQPSGAVDAGAAWSVDGGASWRTSGAFADLAEGTYTLTFREAEGYYTPDPQTVAIESLQTNSLLVAYAAVPPPIATRTIDGTNVTVRLVLPEGLEEVELFEYLREGLDCETDDEDGWWRPSRETLYFDKSPPRGYATAAHEEITITYIVRGEPGTYALSEGKFRGRFTDNTETNATVAGDTIVTIPDPSAIVIPPVPDITAFVRMDAGWQLTFVSTQNVSYAVLTNATPVFGGAEYTEVEGLNGTTTVTIRSTEPSLFFKVRSR